MLSFVAVSIVEFRRAKLVQDARPTGVTVKDIARALAAMASVKALSDFDAGLTGGRFKNGETLLELTIQFAQLSPRPGCYSLPPRRSLYRQ